MLTCSRCDSETRDGVQCTVCLSRFDFPCAGITESGYRRLGAERKATWKCSNCKAGISSPANPASGKLSPAIPIASGELDNIHQQLRKLTDQMSSLPQLIESVKKMQADLSDLKTIKSELTDVKNSITYVHTSIDQFNEKFKEIDLEIQSLKKTKEDMSRFELRLDKIEATLRDNDQRTRLNNIEIKGVPVSPSENLFTIVSKISAKINCAIAKEQINYIARVPQRNNKDIKNIILSVHNRYLRDDFVAAARRTKSLTCKDLGLGSDNKIYVNDHLTLENKQLLNKAKALAKDKDFSFIWVRNCKILVKKDITSPTYTIKTDKDLKKIC